MSTTYKSTNHDQSVQIGKRSVPHTPPVDHEGGEHSSFSDSSEARVCAKSRSAAVLAAARLERLAGGIDSGSDVGAVSPLLPSPLGADESSGLVPATDISTG